MSRAEHILKIHEDHSALLTERKGYKNDAHKAASKALGILAKLRRGINKVPTGSFDNKEKRMLDLITTQVSNYDRSLGNKIRSQVQSVDKELSKYKDDLTKSTKEVEKELTSKRDSEIDTAVKSIRDKVNKDAQSVSDQLQKHFKDVREETYAYILGRLRTIEIEGTDYNKDKIDNLQDALRRKNKEIQRYKTSLDKIKLSIESRKRSAKETNNPSILVSVAHTNLLTRRTNTQEELKKLNIEKKEIITKIAKMRSEITDLVKVADNLIKKLDKPVKVKIDRKTGEYKDFSGLITLGPIEKMKVVVGAKSVELARLDTILNILSTTGDNPIVRDIKNVVSGRERKLTVTRRETYDKINDIIQDAKAEKKRVEDEIKGKYSSQLSQIDKDRKEAHRLVKDHRNSLYLSILKELERIKKEAERVSEHITEVLNS